CARPTLPAAAGIAAASRTYGAFARRLCEGPGAALGDHRHERRPRALAVRVTRAAAARRQVRAAVRIVRSVHRADPVPRSLARSSAAVVLRARGASDLG